MKRSLNNILNLYNFVFAAFLLLMIGLFLFNQKKLAESFILKNFESHQSLIQAKLSNKVKNIENSLKLLKENLGVLDLNLPKKVKFKTYSHLAASAISKYPEQYNTYFAFEEPTAKKLNNSVGLIMTTQRNIKFTGTSGYNNPSNFIQTVWVDPAYQKNTEEVWYHIAKRSKNIEYSDMYFDHTYMKQWLITAGLGIYKKDIYQGMVGVDLFLDDLTREIGRYRFDESGGAFLINNSDGKLITDTISIKKYGYKKLDLVPKELMKKTDGVIEYNLNGFRVYLSVNPLEKLPWTLVVFQSDKEIYQKMWGELVNFGVVFTIIFLITLFLSRKFLHTVASPINGFIDLLNIEVSELKNNKLIKFEKSSNGKSMYEIEQLSEAFSSLSLAVNENFERYQKELTKNIELNKDLDDQVQLKTKDLFKKNEELQEALADLKRTQEKVISHEKLASLGNMTAGVAHEIKNPVYIISNCIKIIKDLMGDLNGTEELSPEDKTYNLETLDKMVDTVEKHCDRINIIISSMLSLTRGEKQELEKHEMKTIVENAIQFSMEAFKSKHSFEYKIEQDISNVGEVNVLKDELARVLINIIDNSLYALKAKKALVNDDEFPATLKVNLFEKDNLIVLEISDNGTGIPKEKIKQIFDPFYTSKPTGEGTGLGLSIALDVIKKHNGNLNVDSEEGKWTKFTIELKKS